MAAVGAEVTASWFLSTGVVSFFILLLLLSIFLTALCSDCGRRSFELEDSKFDKNPSALVRVVKLEETMVARENPMINEIQNDEKEMNREANPVQFTPWRSHLGEPQNKQEPKTEEESSAQFTPWRSHLRAAQSQDVGSSTSPDSNHIYHTIGGERESGGDANASSPVTNHEPRSVALDLNDRDSNSVYAQVSKKMTQSTACVSTPQQVQVEEEEEEESSPPLPDRMAEMEG